MEQENSNMSDKVNWMKKHVDTVIVLGGILACFFWMSGRFNTLELDMNNRFNSLEKDIVMIKTVLIMKNIMPTEMAKEAVK